MPDVPDPVSCPVLIADIDKEALSSASLSVWELELVSITSPECSPAAS